MTSLTTSERESADVGVNIQDRNSDNRVHTTKELTEKLHEDGQTLRLSGVGAHHQNGAAENAIKMITRKARIAMFHAALCWPEKCDKSLWPLAMAHAVHIHNHTPRRSDKHTPMELWTRTKSNHSHLINAHLWDCPVLCSESKTSRWIQDPKI